MQIIVGVSPYSCCVEIKTLGTPSSNVIVSIAIKIFLLGDHEGSPSQIAIKVYYQKVMVALSEHMIISYLLWYWYCVTWEYLPVTSVIKH